ncbi:GNAT family N-acetyltransferase [Roseinatronobacter sp.]|uniref:GNAT family N-acetyltransferase n=1 Tax=Roseinatronobacter sp. TaxID=1945755 RepID=UPI0025ECF52E|nr:GNAT family N-acetyltransferase [Rhodobaca sp.]
MTPEELAHLHRLAFTSPPPWSARDFATFLNDPNCFLLSHIQGGEGQAFGLFRVVADEAELLTLATAPDARRRGLARDVLVKGLAKAQARGAVQCFLEVAADNNAAILLYQSVGFSEVGRRKSYYQIKGHTDVDALVFRAIIG